MSPRKSSTSSARRSDAPRPRYLGLEVAGEHLPALSPRGWETVLHDRLRAADAHFPFRLIRATGARAVVEVGHRRVAEARTVWNGRSRDGLQVTTFRTWGTLVGAKRWLSASRAPGAAGDPTARPERTARPSP